MAVAIRDSTQYSDSVVSNSFVSWWSHNARHSWLVGYSRSTVVPQYIDGGNLIGGSIVAESKE